MNRKIYVCLQFFDSPHCEGSVSRHKGCINVLEEKDSVAREVSNPGLEDGVGHWGVGEVKDGDAEAEMAGQGENKAGLAAARRAMKQNSPSGRSMKSF